MAALAAANTVTGPTSVAGGFQFLSNKDGYDANKASINAGHDRRWDEWKLQEKLAEKKSKKEKESCRS